MGTALKHYWQQYINAIAGNKTKKKSRKFPFCAYTNCCHQLKKNAIIIIFSYISSNYFIVKVFFDKKRNCGFKTLVILGIIIGLTSLGLNYLFDNAFGASTPVNVRTENLTEKNLKIYTIIFWDNDWNGKGSYVNYDTKLKPKETSDFWFGNDNSYFWLVAKNDNNEIEYLNVVTGIENEFDFKITENEIVDSKNAEIAKKLTNETDKNEINKRFAIWANIILIGLLIFSLIKIKTGNNTV